MSLTQIAPFCAQDLHHTKSVHLFLDKLCMSVIHKYSSQKCSQQNVFHCMTLCFLFPITWVLILFINVCHKYCGVFLQIGLKNGTLSSLTWLMAELWFEEKCLLCRYQNGFLVQLESLHPIIQHHFLCCLSSFHQKICRERTCGKQWTLV